MSGSFTRVNYRLRPAKGIERRMMADAFLRLRPFGSVESYRYVGMGSVYFADFTLFHTVCGLTNLVSIEDAEDERTQKRFKFNVPLGSIELKFGHSNVELPKLNWDKVSAPSAGWITMAALPRPVLTDIRFLGARIAPGSLLAVTVDTRLGEDESGREGNLLDRANRPNRNRRKAPYSHRSRQETQGKPRSQISPSDDNDTGTDGRNQRAERRRAKGAENNIPSKYSTLNTVTRHPC